MHVVSHYSDMFGFMYDTGYGETYTHGVNNHWICSKYRMGVFIMGVKSL